MKFKTVYEWLAKYKEVHHDEWPDKPLYLDYRSVPSIRQIIVMTFDTDKIIAEEYNEAKHGEVNTKRFYTFMANLH